MECDPLKKISNCVLEPKKMCVTEDRNEKVSNKKKCSDAECIAKLRMKKKFRRNVDRKLDLINENSNTIIKRTKSDVRFLKRASQKRPEKIFETDNNCLSKGNLSDVSNHTNDNLRTKVAVKEVDNVPNTSVSTGNESDAKQDEISLSNNIVCSQVNKLKLNKSTSKRKKITLQDYKSRRDNIISGIQKTSKDTHLPIVNEQNLGKSKSSESSLIKVLSFDIQKFNQKLSCISISSKITHSSKNSASIFVSFNSEGICLELPRYKISSKTVPVQLSESEVEHILVYCDKFSSAFISIITSPKLGEALKETLKTYKKQSPYFNPDTETVKELKFSFLLRNVTDAIVTFLHGIYKDKLVKIDQDSAAVMLKASSPKNNSNSPPLSVSRIFVYPPVGGIQVKSSDIACLANGSLLNDTIIEFYLKFIYHEKIPPEIQERTHIFSSFFYQALEHAFLNKFKNKQKQEKDVDSLKNKWIMNNSWIKNVDIFSKDFIFIPINRKRHWYLAVICYLPELLEISNDKEIVLDCDAPEKEESFKLLKSHSENNTRKTRKRNENPQTKKREPCICFFDSMDHRFRMNDTKREVAKTLKEFLEKLWNSRNPDKTCDWKKLLFLKAPCPQQKNRYDCGIYLLQYVESFFKKPIAYFRDPMPDLRDWFPHDCVKHKRTEIKNVISQLKEELSCTAVSTTTSFNDSDIIDLT